MPPIERRRKIVDRVTDPPQDEPGPKIAPGCAIAAIGMMATIGALGLVAGAWTRFGAPALAGAAEEGDDGGGTARTDPGAGSGAGPRTGPGTGVGDPLADMQRRYVPGPHVRLEGMIPADHALGSTGSPHAWTRGRAADTPWIVSGARFEPGPPPTGGGQPAPRCAHAPGEPSERPLTILAGVPSEVRVVAADASGGTAVTRYMIAFDGYRGHFVLPATVPSELGLVSAGGSDGATVRFTIGAAIRPEGRLAVSGETFLVNMRIAAIDDQGRTSPWVVRALQIQPVGTGDVEVALTMSEPTDLDLYVTDPTGNTIYFGNTSSVSGGQLDLDANAACSGNVGIDTEHVFWPQGRAPRGTYTVRVAHYESCVAGRPVDYRVTVRNCGETVVLSGRFVGWGRAERCLASAQDPAFCQDVVSFVVPPCRTTN